MNRIRRYILEHDTEGGPQMEPQCSKINYDAPGNDEEAAEKLKEKTQDDIIEYSRLNDLEDNVDRFWFDEHDKLHELPRGDHHNEYVGGHASATQDALAKGWVRGCIDPDLNIYYINVDKNHAHRLCQIKDKIESYFGFDGEYCTDNK